MFYSNAERAVEGVSKETFDKWLDSSGRKMKEFADHSIVKDALERGEGGEKAELPEGFDTALRDKLVEGMRESGVPVSTDWEESQRILDVANGRVTLSRGKKRAIETAPLNPKEGSPADISTADGAKVQKNLDSLANKLEKVANRRKNFISEVAKEIGAKQDGSDSWYRTFSVENGTDVTIRLGNHNATVSNFDFRDEDNGISIVVSKRANEGIKNDGSAHIVEYFYSEIALRKAYGKPLADIVRSIKDALETGEYKDVTGLAEREEVNADELRQYKQSVEDAKVTRMQKVSPVFYSNAERAVEGVKQGKASGEQWLAMIQKNGGLKAGEDKWLGLSDWLNERKGKSVTKEEVLDFIRKNQVEVEEVRYSAVRDFNKYGKVDSTTVNLSVFTKHLKWLCSCS